MCEFKVVVDGEVVFEDAIYAKKDGDRVIVRDIVGESREFKGHEILEVDVKSTRLVLSPMKKI